PILWVASNPTGGEGPAVSPARPRVTAVVPIATQEPAGGDAAARLETEIAPSLLLGARAPGPDSDTQPVCALSGGAGAVLASDGPPAKERSLSASAPVSADGWVAAAAWRLDCQQSVHAAMAFVEPVAARSRTTLALNLGAMGLAVLLGLLAVREVAQR